MNGAAALAAHTYSGREGTGLGAAHPYGFAELAAWKALASRKYKPEIFGLAFYFENRPVAQGVLEEGVDCYCSGRAPGLAFVSKC